MLDNYPPGAANDPLAPYNQCDPEPIEVEVTVSITLSKTVKVYVDDYIQEAPESDGEVYYAGDIDLSNCDLHKAVMKQITLPNESNEFKDWNVDDFEVILE